MGVWGTGGGVFVTEKNEGDWDVGNGRNMVHMIILEVYKNGGVDLRIDMK